MTPERSSSQARTLVWRAFDLMPEDARVLVVGLGKTGLSVVRFLMRYGIEFAVVDNRRCPPGLAELETLNPDAAIFLGEYDRQAFNAATHFVVSPGIGLDLPVIQDALKSGVVLLSDIDLFSGVVKAPIAGITGSNGKSTVTTLLGCMAKKAGWVTKVGGNLGTPALDLISEDELVDLYVLELSSFQLERTSNLNTSVATVLNISEDHMDRYADLSEYTAAKQRIFAGCDTFVINKDDALVAAMAANHDKVVSFGLKGNQAVDFGIICDAEDEWIVSASKPLVNTRSLRIKGQHNVANALAALAMGQCLGISEQVMVDALKNFSGLPHRMQWVEEIDGVTWINDSKATNVGACVAALNGLQGKAILIAGGDAKDADFRPLKAAVKKKVRAVVLIGKDAELLHKILQTQTQTICASHLRQAISVAGKLAKRGDTVLLSPACASLDQFSDYQERGREFESAVKEMTHGH